MIRPEEATRPPKTRENPALQVEQQHAKKHNVRRTLGFHSLSKDSWHYTESDEEDELLQKATARGVFNVARYYHHVTVHIRGQDDDVRAETSQMHRPQLSVTLEDWEDKHKGHLLSKMLFFRPYDKAVWCVGGVYAPSVTAPEQYKATRIPTRV